MEQAAPERPKENEDNPNALTLGTRKYQTKEPKTKKVRDPSVSSHLALRK